MPPHIYMQTCTRQPCSRDRSLTSVRSWGLTNGHEYQLSLLHQEGISSRVRVPTFSVFFNRLSIILLKKEFVSCRFECLRIRLWQWLEKLWHWDLGCRRLSRRYIYPVRRGNRATATIKIVVPRSIYFLKEAGGHGRAGGYTWRSLVFSIHHRRWSVNRSLHGRTSSLPLFRRKI